MDLSPIVEFAEEIKRRNSGDTEMDISVFNGAVKLTINEWSKVDVKCVFSSHIVCESHAEACLIQNVLTAFIHMRT